MPNPDYDRAIEKARPMLAWTFDWDGEGAQPIDPAAWEEATALGRLICREAHCPAPSFGACNDGSLDLWWHSPSAESDRNHWSLLINVPVGGPMAMYGLSPNSTIKSGNINPAMDADWIAAWLIARPLPERNTAS